MVVIGHCRLLGAQRLGMEEVPCVCVDSLTPEQVNALRIVDNKTNESPWDFDFLADELAEVDLSDFDFDFGLPSEEIDWENVEEINEENYEKPESDKLRCPICGGVDEKIRFKKV